MGRGRGADRDGDMVIASGQLSLFPAGRSGWFEWHDLSEAEKAIARDAWYDAWRVYELFCYEFKAGACVGIRPLKWDAVSDGETNA